jgi:hypothetical protein
MPVPFPSPTFPQNYTPYPLKAPVEPANEFTAASAFRGASPPTTIFYFDPVSLVAHVASVTSNDGKTLTINSEGKSIPLNIAGDGTAQVPVGVLVSP